MAELRTITILIDSDTDRELERLAAVTGQSKPDLACDAVIERMIVQGRGTTGGHCGAFVPRTFALTPQVLPYRGVSLGPG